MKGGSTGAILALGAVGYLLAIAFASLHPGPAGWGLHLAAFLPPASLLPVAALLLTGAILLERAALEERRAGKTAPGERRAGMGRAPKTRGDRPPRGGFGFAPPGFAWALLIPFAGILSALRERSYFLGDQWVWFENIQAGRQPLYTEPLAAVAWYRFADLLRALHLPLEPPALGLLSVLCRLARETVSPILVGLALGVAISSHILLLYLAPSYLLLIGGVRASRLAKAGLLALPFATAGAALLALGLPLQELARPFLALHTSMRVGGGPQPGWMPALSPWPPLDFGNLVLLVMPVPALILAARLAARSWSPWEPRGATRFLTAAAAPGLIAALALLLAGTLAQDWDLLAMTVLPVAILGIQAGQTIDAVMGSRTGRAGLVALSLGSVLAFVLVNASEKSGVRRFQILMSESAHLKPHERAFGNEKLFKHFAKTAEYESMLIHARRALAADSVVVRYWAGIGSALYALRRPSEAAPYFEEAVRRGTNVGGIFYCLGECYVAERRYAEAVPQYRAAIRLDGEREVYRRGLDLALEAAGDTTSARSP